MQGHPLADGRGTINTQSNPVVVLEKPPPLLGPDRARRVRDRDLSVEELVLSWETPLAEIAAAADIVPDMANGGDALGAQLAGHITTLTESNQGLEQDVRESEQRVAEMSEESRLLDENLGGSTAERSALMQRLQRQARIKEQVETF